MQFTDPILSELLIAIAPRYRYCSGATFTVAPLILAESSGDGSAATILAAF